MYLISILLLQFGHSYDHSFRGRLIAASLLKTNNSEEIPGIASL